MRLVTRWSRVLKSEVEEVKKLIEEVEGILGGITLDGLLESPRVSPRESDTAFVALETPEKITTRVGPLKDYAPPSMVTATSELEFVSKKQFTKIKKRPSPKAQSETSAKKNVNWAENHKLRNKIRELKEENKSTLSENEGLKKELGNAKKMVEQLRKVVDRQKKELGRRSVVGFTPT